MDKVVYPQYQEKRIVFDPRFRINLEEKALSLAESFIPVSPTNLKQAKEILKAEDSPGDRDDLIKKIKADPALFLYCVKHLNSLVDRGKDGLDPISALKAIEHEKLQMLFDVSPKEISPHRRDRATELQALRIQHSVVSSCAAQTLARDVGVEPEMAFTTATFRQLGLHLISWNHQKAYSQAMIQRRRKGTDLEQEIKLILGFSPSEIGMQHAMKWGLKEDLRAALKVNPASLEGTAEIQSLRDLCEVSELYSKRKDPKNFPEAEKIWTKRKTDFEAVFSKESFQEIEHESNRVLKSYAQEGSAFTKLPLFADEVASKSSAVIDELSKDYLHGADLEIKQSFENVYRLASDSAVAVEAIKVLVEQTIPKAGFRRGCLLLLNTTNFSLQPALRVGDMQLSVYNQFLRENKALFLSTVDSLVPLKFQGPGVNDDTATLVLGSILSTSHPGVLYLELSERARHDSRHATIELFNLVRQAFARCLGGSYS